MTRKIIDWEISARQFVRAFQIVEACAFAEKAGKWELRKSDQLMLSSGQRDSIHTREGLALDVCVDEHSMYLALISDGPDGTLLCTDLTIVSNGALISSEPSSYEHSAAMAEALFHLNLLTTEIEAALRVSISSHQKMVWSLERDN